MRFGFADRTRALLRGVWTRGTISAAAARNGIDPANAARHLRTAERRAGVRLVDRRRGGRGGRNASLTRAGRRLLDLDALLGVALAFVARHGVTPVRVGGRVLFVAGAVPRGPVEIRIPPEAVALDRRAAPGPRSSVRNRFPARVETIEPLADGVFRIHLMAGALPIQATIVRGALRDLQLRVGSRVHVNIKAAALVVARP